MGADNVDVVVVIAVAVEVDVVVVEVDVEVDAGVEVVAGDVSSDASLLSLSAQIRLQSAEWPFFQCSFWCSLLQ